MATPQRLEGCLLSQVMSPCARANIASPHPQNTVQDAVVGLASAHFVGVLMRVRRRLAPLLLPPRFDSPRDIRWHSAPDALVPPIWGAEAAAEAAAAGVRDTNYIAFSGVA